MIYELISYLPSDSIMAVIGCWVFDYIEMDILLALVVMLTVLPMIRFIYRDAEIEDPALQKQEEAAYNPADYPALARA